MAGTTTFGRGSLTRCRQVSGVVVTFGDDPGRRALRPGDLEGVLARGSLRAWVLNLTAPHGVDGANNVVTCADRCGTAVGMAASCDVSAGSRRCGGHLSCQSGAGQASSLAAR